MNKLKSLAGETALYGLGSIVPRVLNFFLVILHTRVFLPDTYGIYINLYAWVAFLNIIYLFGMETAYFRFATKEGANEPNVFRTAQTFVVLVGIILTAGLIALAPMAAGYFQVEGHPEFIVWLSILMLVDAVVAIPFARLRLQKRPLMFASAKVINVAIVIGLNFYFLLVAYDPAIGIGYPILANLIANVFYVFFFLTTLIKWRPLWDRQVMASMFTYAWPIMLMGLAGMTNEMFSRLTLGWWLPDGFYPGKDAQHALGVFGACFRFSVIVNVAVQAFRFAAEPFFFSQATDKKSPALFAKVNHYFLVVCMFIVVGIMVNLDLLKYLIDKEYWDGLVIVPYLLYGYVFLGLYYNLSVWYKLTDKTYFGTIITLFGVAITLSLNYILIPIYGYLGSSWATLACYSIMAVTSYFLGQKYFPVPYPIGKALEYFGLSIVLIAIAGSFAITNQWIATLFHLTLMVIYMGYTWLRERASWNPSGPIS